MKRGYGKSRTGRKRYVMLRHWLLDSPAWQSLPGNARALYIEMARRYNGSNNGRIPYSAREAAKSLPVSKGTVIRLFKILEERGFIVRTKRGAFSRKTIKEASEWRLTECDSDTPVDHATKDFMRWQPPAEELDAPNQQPSRHRKSKTRTHQRVRVGTLASP